MDGVTKTTRWNSKEAIIQYRQSWEKHMNQALERAGRPERVDCRSYQEQGTDTISGIHLGSHTSKDKSSERYRMNEEIKKLNETNKRIRETLDSLESQITEKSDSFYESLAEQLGKVESDIISAKYNFEVLQEQQDSLKSQSQKLHDSINRVQTARSNMLKKSGITGNDFPAQGRTEGKIPCMEQPPCRNSKCNTGRAGQHQFPRTTFFKDSGRRGFFQLMRFPAGITDINTDGERTETDGKTDFLLRAKNTRLFQQISGTLQILT